jgi:hypothetical protein
MQRFLRYFAALTILVLVGATVATVDAAPGRSISAFVSGNNRGDDNGHGQNGNREAGDDEDSDDNGQPANQDDVNDDDDANEAVDEETETANDGADEGNGKTDEDEDSDDENAGNGQVHAGQEDHKVIICHHTGSASNPVVAIAVDEHAVPAHERHGDTIVEDEAECVAALPAKPTEMPTETAATPIASPTGSPVASPVASPVVL